MLEPGATVLITGGTGFVGAAVVRAALARGLRVRALARPNSPRHNLQGLDVELVEGDLTVPATLEPALQGVRYLLHVAADYRLWTRDPEACVKTNLHGTVALMEAALRQGVERIVYTSSVATLHVTPDTVAADETMPLDAAHAIGGYKRSKVLGERAVEALVRKHALPAVIVNPSTPIGARDIKPTPTGRLIVEAACGRMPAFVDTGMNFVSVDDVAHGHLLALERGRIGERYVLGGENVTLRELLTQIAARVDRSPPRIELPRGPLYPIAMAAEAWARVSGREPFVTRDGLKMSRNRMFFSSAKAQAELGYVPRSYLEALKEALDWFGANGYLRRGYPPASVPTPS